MSNIYEIGSVIVTNRGGGKPEILFGETEMIFYRGHAYCLPQIVTGKAYETSLDSVLKFEEYGKNRVKKYLRDEIGIKVRVNANTIFRKDGENVVIEWIEKKCPCESQNKSTLNPDRYEKLKELATFLCAK